MSTLETLVDSRFFAAVFSAANINISYPFQSVNKFFKVFYIFQLAFHPEKNGSVYRFQTEKEGFEPSRRVNDLHP